MCELSQHMQVSEAGQILGWMRLSEYPLASKEAEKVVFFNTGES